jgi:outer membrane protein assembly factor BamB
VISGLGFGGFEAVDVFFGTAEILLTTADAGGSFEQQSATVPSSDVPGRYSVSAVGRRSGLATSANFVIPTAWSETGHDPMHTGFDPFENVISPENVATLHKVWSTSLPQYPGESSTPSVRGGILYVGSLDRNLYALGGSTGRVEWKFETGYQTIPSPAVRNGVVYQGSYDGYMYAVNAATGTLMWKFFAGVGVASSATVVNGVVYFGSDSHNIYALNAATGAKLWSFTTGGNIGASSPAVADGLVFVGSYDYYIYALNARTGKLVWRFDGGYYAIGSPTVANSTVYVSSENGLFALNERTGALRWSAPIVTSTGSSPAIANGVLYVGGTGFEGLYALNPRTGAEIWHYSNGYTDFSSPSVANGITFVTDDTSVLALQASDGHLLWSQAASLDPSGVIIANGRLYLAEAASVVAYEVDS